MDRDTLLRTRGYVYAPRWQLNEREGDTLAVLTRSLFLLSNRTCDRRDPRRIRGQEKFRFAFFFLIIRDKSAKRGCGKIRF